MLSALYVEKPHDQLRPEPPPEVKLGPPFFWPYSASGGWSGRVFSCTCGSAYNRTVRNFSRHLDRRLGRRLASCFHALLADIAAPFDPAKAEAEPSSTIIPPGSRGPAHRDWGLTAELASLLRVPAVVSLLQASGTDDMATIESKREALETALVETFDTFAGLPEIFHHTHAASFAWALDILGDAAPSVTGLRNIDDDLRDLRIYGTTERALDRFLDRMLAAAGARVSDVDKHSLVGFLVTKLEVGRYKPAGPAWDKILAQPDTTSVVPGRPRHGVCRAGQR